MGAGSPSKFSFPKHRLRENHTAIVTGANTGIGFQVAKHLAFLGARVILACRNENKAKAAILRIEADFLDFKEKFPHEAEKFAPDRVKLEYIHLDLSSFESVTEFVRKFKSKKYPLHTLVCNAGVAMVPQGITKDNHEIHFQVNYLSHFLLIIHLLPILRKSGNDSRVISVTSTDHSSGHFTMKNVQGKINYRAAVQYANSKLYQIMMTYALHRCLIKDKHVSFYAVSPSKVDTDLFDSNLKGWAKTSYEIGKTFGTVSTNVLKSATTVINIAVNPALKELNGEYFDAGIPCVSSGASRKTKNQEFLWKYSVDCFKEYVSQALLDDVTKEYLSDSD